MKKIFKVSLYAFFIVSVLLAGVSYYIVTHFLDKPYHSSEQRMKKERSREKMIERYGGIHTSFASKDGTKLSALVFYRPQATYNLIVCHGWWMVKEDLKKLISLFGDANIFLFDFRGHGQSEGAFTSIGCFERQDVWAAFEFVEQDQRMKTLPTYGLGYSMGAASLLGAAAQGVPFKGIILDSMFGSLADVIQGTFSHQTGLPAFPLFNLCKTWYQYFCNCSMDDISPLEWAQLVSIPILMIHSHEDHLVAANTAQKTFDNIQSTCKELWEVPKGKHALIWKQYKQEYQERIESFIQQVQETLSQAHQKLRSQ